MDSNEEPARPLNSIERASNYHKQRQTGPMRKVVDSSGKVLHCSPALTPRQQRRHTKKLRHSMAKARAR